MSAASQGHLDVCKLLIDMGVAVDAVAENGESTGTEFLYNDVRDGLCRAVLKNINP